MRLLDLFCGAGGCACGYSRAGFADIVGVDIKPQPRYPFAFVQGDALEYLAAHGREFDAIHASPPCQRFSTGTRVWKGRAAQHPDLIAPTRELLVATGKPWVIENVEGAPLECPATVCGLALRLGVKRHRLFESSVFLFSTTCPRGHKGGYYPSVFGQEAQDKIGGKRWVTIYGGGAPKSADRRRRAPAALAATAMGIDWMNRDELSQAIPPAYTEFVGRQLLDAINGGA